MKLHEWLQKATEKLESAGIGTARLDLFVLLEDCLNTSRAQLLAHLECELSNEQIKQLEPLLKRRVKHEPLAYIRNKTEFYGRQFYINHNVLEPRPESETMIDQLKSLPLPPKLTIIDVGSGSGALAITVKLELPSAKVMATDIDKNCLEVAKRNAKNLEANVKFIEGDLLKPIATHLAAPYILLCNLPYVPDDFHINPAAMNEPRIAIFGGKDGLDLYKRLFKQLETLENEPKFILTESMPPQHKELAEIAKATGFRLDKTDDFIQVFTTTS
jgi:release factor glutamine methyltransferase